MKIEELLDKCKEELEVDSDYRLGKITGINDARISEYRKGKTIPDNYACFKIAEILNIDAEMLIAQFEAENEKNAIRKEFWKKKAVSMGTSLASIIFVVTFIVTPTPSQAAPTHSGKVSLCILC